MKYINFADFHTHSKHSFDGNHSVNSLCEFAVNKGIRYLAITDHCEIDAKNFDFDIFCKNQYKDTNNAKTRFKSDLNVYNGIELGQAVYNIPLAEKVLKNHHYDFVLGSIHNLENMEDFYFLDYNNFDVMELLNRYFDTVIKLCKWGNFDSLAHLTYPLRYICGKYKINIDLADYSDKIDTILKLLIKKDKALEINTSGLGMEIKDFLPNEEIIKRFKEFGGKYVTIGSDSHYKEKLGNYIEQGLDTLKKCGFDCFTIFENRKPKLIEIK